jgi:hypothetical protein
MGYFDGLASAIIKKDKDGNAVYYPWGVLGKGYVLPDAERETEIKNMVILFYQCIIGLFFIHIFILKSILILLLLTVGLVIWLLVKSNQLTKDCPKSDEKLTLKEGYTNSAKAHNKTVLWLLLVVALLFTLSGIAFLFTANLFILGLLMILLFGASSAAIFYMITVKNKQEKTPD